MVPFGRGRESVKRYGRRGEVRMFERNDDANSRVEECVLCVEEVRLLAWKATRCRETSGHRGRLVGA